jgi:hypothetical protein
MCTPTVISVLDLIRFSHSARNSSNSSELHFLDYPIAKSQSMRKVGLFPSISLRLYDDGSNSLGKGERHGLLIFYIWFIQVLSHYHEERFSLSYQWDSGTRQIPRDV